MGIARLHCERTRSPRWPASASHARAPLGYDSAGDFNEFPFGESLQVLESAGLSNLMETLPAGERYTYVFEGNAQAIDHLLVSPALGERLVPDGFDIVHVNAEYREQASDHDPQVARLSGPAA